MTQNLALTLILILPLTFAPNLVFDFLVLPDRPSVHFIPHSAVNHRYSLVLHQFLNTLTATLALSCTSFCNLKPRWISSGRGIMRIHGSFFAAKLYVSRTTSRSLGVGSIIPWVCTVLSDLVTPSSFESLISPSAWVLHSLLSEFSHCRRPVLAFVWVLNLALAQALVLEFTWI